MGAAYYIVLDREINGFDSFVDGKAVARETTELDTLTQCLGLKDINEFVSADPDDLIAMADELGIDLPNVPPPEAWFDPEEGLSWVSKLESHLIATGSAVSDSAAVLADLAEYREVLERAKAHSARWHFAVDF